MEKRTGRITWFVNARGLLEKSPGRWGRISVEPVTTLSSFCDGNRELNGHRFGGREATRTMMSFDEEAEATRKAVILVPFEFSERSLEAARVGVSIARHTGGQLVLCHALYPKVVPFGPANPPWVRGALRHEAMEKMKPVVEMAREAGITATCEIEEGTPTAVILKVAGRWGADLMILTAEEQGIWNLLLFGRRTTAQVLERAECHVMVLRHCN